VVVLKHVFECLQVELGVVGRMLPKTDGFVFVNDAANLDYLAAREADFVLVAQDLYLGALVSQHAQRSVVYGLNLADEGDCAAHEVAQMLSAHERVGLPVHILHLFCHCVFCLWCG
jgi:hypothetical protein